MEKIYKTREEWLIAAVPLTNKYVFNDELDIHDFQVSCGWCAKKTSMAETIVPRVYEEDITLKDMFPPSIQISIEVESPVDIIAVLSHEMIHAFCNILSHNKQFGAYARKIGFEKPFTQFCPTDILLNNCQLVVNELGEWPGIPIPPVVKEAKEKKPRRGKMFCPNCGFECRTTPKMLQTYGLPTCACGSKMGEDLGDDIENQDSSELPF